MPRNTIPEIKAIIEVPVNLDDASIQAFLTIASLVVSEDLEPIGSLSVARLKAIEAFLCAHFVIQLTERGGLASSKTGDAQDNYTVLSPMGNEDINGLQLTRYGNQALFLDTTGKLQEMSRVNKLSARFTVIGDRTANGIGCEA